MSYLIRKKRAAQLFINVSFVGKNLVLIHNIFWFYLRHLWMLEMHTCARGHHTLVSACLRSYIPSEHNFKLKAVTLRSAVNAYCLKLLEDTRGKS